MVYNLPVTMTRFTTFSSFFLSQHSSDGGRPGLGARGTVPRHGQDGVRWEDELQTSSWLSHKSNLKIEYFSFLPVVKKIFPPEKFGIVFLLNLYKLFAIISFL